MPKYSYDPTVKQQLLASLDNGPKKKVNPEQTKLALCFQVLDSFEDGRGYGLYEAFRRESLEFKDLGSGAYQVDIGSYNRFMFKIIHPNTTLSDMKISHT